MTRAKVSRSKITRRAESRPRRTARGGGAAKRVARVDARSKADTRSKTDFGKRARAQVADRKSTTTRMDAWTNAHTLLGTYRDKRMHTFFMPDIVTDTEAINLWRSDDVCRKIVEARPKTAFRRGIRLKLQDKELAEACATDLEALELTQKFVTALCYRNAFGGGAIYPAVDDGASLTEELDENNIQKVHAFHVFEPRELTPVAWYDDINHPKFRQVKIWRFVPLNNYGIFQDGGYIHESRLIIFQGRKVSNQVQSFQRPGWGDSEFTGTYSIVRDFGTVWGHVGALVQDFAQGILRMNKFADLMKDAEGEAIVRARLAMFDFERSTMRMGVVDKEDEFSRQTTPMGGLSEILHDYALRVAAAVGIPVTLLFGMAPAGLNATGDNDVRAWYDEVAAWREQEVKPALEHAVRIYMKSREGATGGVEPEVWGTEFPPLWEPSEKEVADTRFTIAQTDKIYAVDIGGPTPEEIMESRWRGDTFSGEMVIDWKSRDAQKKAEEKAAREAQALEQSGMPTEDVQAQALNGAQVESMLSIVDKVTTKQMPRENGINALLAAFPTWDRARAEGIIPPEDFTPAPPAAKPNPFGGTPPESPPTPPPQNESPDLEEKQAA